jgi:DNA-binding CsgD family transcriptional regulator
MSDYDPENPYDLSAMELEVAGLLVTGRDVRGVAVSLGISTAGVAQLHEAACRKVRAQNDLHLAHLLATCRGSDLPKTDFVCLDV